MMRSLFSGVSGLKTHQTKMDVIGNNISNVNTVAFKSSSTTFSDIMYQTTSQASGATETRGGVNAKQIGLGVTNGATKIAITSSGAAQSTGDALDIRLTDTKTTNFFIVNNGTENVFTRAGSFYIDGNGNLAMTTTGYLVMGWQVDETTGDIKKDTVSALRVMQAKNQTSEPEATTNATFTGVIDQNDTNVTSSDGYMRSLTVYDSLGYSYTGKFSIKVVDKVKGEYSVELVSLLDSKGNDLYKTYLNESTAANPHLATDIFGENGIKTNTYSLQTGFDVNSYTKDGATSYALVYKNGDEVYRYVPDNAELIQEGGKASDVKLKFYKVTSTDGSYDDKSTPKEFTLNQVYNLTSDEVSEALTAKITVGTSKATSTLTSTFKTVNYGLKFDTKEGTLQSITKQEDGGSVNLGTTVVLQASKLGPNRDPEREDNAALADITIDFSQLLNFDNGGTSTVVANKGDTDGTTGAGKKLGTMTGLSVSNDGRIYGSYSNGNTVLLGQISVAQFANASGLEEIGNNCYKTTLNSGDFDGMGLDVSADGSSMSTGQLEMSNVDLSSEFTEMIVTQRGFQANSRIITVSDTLLEELINLKR